MVKTSLEFIDLAKSIAGEYQSLRDIIWYSPEGRCTAFQKEEKLILGDYDFGLVYIASPAVTFHLPQISPILRHGKLNAIALGLGVYDPAFHCNSIKTPQEGMLAYYDSIEKKAETAVCFNLETETITSVHSLKIDPIDQPTLQTSSWQALETALHQFPNTSLEENLKRIMAAIYETQGLKKR